MATYRPTMAMRNVLAEMYHGAGLSEGLEPGGVWFASLNWPATGHQEPVHTRTVEALLARGLVRKGRIEYTARERTQLYHLVGDLCTCHEHIPEVVL